MFLKTMILLPKKKGKKGPQFKAFFGLKMKKTIKLG